MRRCPLCGHWDVAILYPSNLPDDGRRDDHYDCTSFRLALHREIYRCASCSFAFNDAAPEAIDHLEEYARNRDPEYLEQRSSRRLTYARELDRIEPLTSGRDLLDVGCHAGFFLELARERGFRVAGVEPSRWAAEHAKAALGLDIFNGPIERYETDRRFDVITLWDVIEHLEDPVGVLERVRELLRPQGLLAFTTHNLDSLPARLLRGRYPLLMEMHTVHLNNRTRELLLTKTGFEQVALHPHRRALRVGYLLSRLGRLGELPAALAMGAARRLGLAERIVWIGGVGLETVLARPQVAKEHRDEE
jgi:2-polyprenyl-3-methyl-5-hydroxy-6-metoxy-1,4-benzoquinol methylase